MPTGATDQNIAIKIAADVQQAISQLRAVQSELQKTGAAAQSAGRGAGDLNAALGGSKSAQATAQAAAAKTTDALNDVGEAATSAGLNVGKLGTAFGRVAGNLATGNVKGAALSMKGVGTAAAEAGTGMLGLVGGVTLAVAALGAVAVAFVEGARQSEAFRKSLIATGQSGTITAGQLNDIVDRVGKASGSYASARTALAAFAASGRVSAAQMETATQTAANLATATGDIGEATKTVMTIMTGSAQDIINLTTQYHFLTAAQVDHIQQLFAEGQADQARAEALAELSAAAKQRAGEVQESAGIMVRAWNGVTGAIKGMWQALKNVGATKSLQDQLDKAQQVLTNLSTPNSMGIMGTPAQIAAARAQVADLQRQLADQQAAQQRAAKTQADTEASIAAGQRLQQFQSPEEILLQKRKQAAKDLVDYLRSPHTDQEIQAAVEHRNNALDQAQKAYDAATKQPAGPKAPAVDDSALRAAQQAQDALTQSLVQLQAQLSPTAAAWATYNATVAKATEQAALAKGVPGADPAAIEQQRDAVVALAATIRDAAIDKIADQDREAWQKLLDTIGQSVPQMPRALSTLANPIDVGGSNSLLGRSMRDMAAQMDWYGKAQDALAKDRDAALKQYQGDRDKETQIQKNYDEQQEDLAAKHVDAVNKIQQAQYFGELSMASDAFGQLAQVAAQRYGEQSKQYQMLFALSKAFAVAQAAVSLATNVSKASEYGFPQNIPFIIGAFAQGAQIISILAGAQFSGGGGGYAEGGYTGPGGKHQVAGYVHAGEVVWSQSDVRRAGGVHVVESWRRGLPGYAEGGIVSPFAAAPSPAELGFTAPSAPSFKPQDAVAATSPQQQRNAPPVVFLVNSEAEAMERMAKLPAFQKAVVQTVGDNPRTIRTRWGN